MSEDFAANLEMYRVQLQQVEAAILAEPDNDELKKLRVDLQEVIAVTKDLVSPNPDASSSSSTVVPKTSIKWKVGDKCMAKSSKNGVMYEATIESIADAKVAVAFVGRPVTDVCTIFELKPVPIRKPGDVQGIWNKPTKPGAANAKKAEWQEERERKKKKLQKRIQKQKELDAIKEVEKSKWKAFTNKAISKSMKGVKKETSALINRPEANLSSSSSKSVGSSSTTAQFNFQPGFRGRASNPRDLDFI